MADQINTADQAMAPAALPQAPQPFPLRRKPRRPVSSPRGGNSWLATFADMVTLLLTFLVLLISVTTLDPRTPFTRPDGVLDEDRGDYVRLADGVLMYSNRGLLAPVIELTENLDLLPEALMFDQKEIKRAIFQTDPARAAEYEELQEAVDEGITIFKDNRGLVIQWDRSLLFEEGKAELAEENLPLMRSLAVFLQSVSLPISIEGHTNPFSEIEGGQGREAFELSLARSRAVMNYLTALGPAEKRFRIGGHGGARPRSADPDQAWENSRLEVIIYTPPRGSLFAR
ncbi:OmpA family protein [Deltaproteobacteria bacterium OttesenSCG-928-K17]|nr:OmpA family protein [Deltaproteobacteria bacterium OttesenSCG-928-K17]